MLSFLIVVSLSIQVCREKPKGQGRTLLLKLLSNNAICKTSPVPACTLLWSSVWSVTTLYLGQFYNHSFSFFTAQEKAILGIKRTRKEYGTNPKLFYNLLSHPL